VDRIAIEVTFGSTKLIDLLASLSDGHDVVAMVAELEWSFATGAFELKYCRWSSTSFASPHLLVCSQT
jgi:hypothetical protein